MQSDKAKANLTVRQLINHLLLLKIDVVDNRNFIDRPIGSANMADERVIS